MVYVCYTFVVPQPCDLWSWPPPSFTLNCYISACSIREIYVSTSWLHLWYGCVMYVNAMPVLGMTGN